MTMQDLHNFGAELESIGAVKLNDANKRLSAAAARLRAGIDPYESDPTLATEPDPVTWAEKLLHDQTGKRLKLWPHQAEDLRLSDSQIVHQDGRETGKTVNIVASVLHFANTTSRGLGLVATPHQSSLDTIVDYIETQFEMCPALAAGVKIVRQPYVKMIFGRTGSVIHFRQAGPYGEAFRSLHVDRIWVDEAAWMPEKAWKALGRCLLSDGVMRLYSNPNGLRDTEYYRFTTHPAWRVVKWPSWITPTWSDRRKQEFVDYYNGENSPGWQHEVAGEHGEPSFAAFDVEAVMRAQCAIEHYALRRLSGDLLSVSVTSESETEKPAIEETFEKEMSSIAVLLDLPPRRGVFYVGGDLGYTSDPAEITMAEESPDGTLSLILRLHLEHVPYPQQCMIFACIEREYRPVGYGIDAGSNGMAVFHDLTQLPQYRSFNFAKRMQAFDFGGSIVIGEDADGHPIKAYTKEYMTKLLNEAFIKNRFALPSGDNEIINQLATQTYTRNNDRRIVYGKKNDHINDSLRGLVLRRDRETNEYANPGGAVERVLRPVFAKGFI